jgi:integrase
MNKRKSSNLSGSTIKSNETLGNSAFHFLSAPTEKVSAPSIYDIVFEVEGPYLNDIEMLHKINCINCNGDVTKRWYVEYYITCPETNKSLRKREYGFVNKEKAPEARQELLYKLKSQIIHKIEVETGAKDVFISNDKKSVTAYMNEYLAEKRKVLEFESIRTYVKALKIFHKYLKDNNLTAAEPKEITKQTMILFRNSLTKKNVNRTVNNQLDFIKSFFSYIIKNYDHVLYKNPCDNIDKLPSKSESHIAYTKKQAQDISKYLQKNDVQLLNYCRFVALGFLRCKETRNLKVGDIDFDKKTITLSAKIGKTHKRTVKPMLETLYQHVLEMNIRNLPAHYYVFTTQRKPGTRITFDNYFQKNYKKVKKKFGLSNKHTIYSFRHTFVCELLDSGASWHEIMKYTGHTTFAAFEKYARSILNKPATDLSSSIKINF